MIFKSSLSIAMEGHVRIKEFLSLDDLNNGVNYKTLVDKHNDIHPENMSILIARAISAQNYGAIYSMAFGTGGATIDNVGNVQYASPNTTGNADLNTPIYFKVLNANSSVTSDNIMLVRHINGVSFSDIEIHCVLDKNEPYGQLPTSATSANVNSYQFNFDEIGLKTEDGLLCTHIVFNPIQKSSDVILEIVYTLRINISQG